jgi:hypothetical protein
MMCVCTDDCIDVIGRDVLAIVGSHNCDAYGLLARHR